MGFLDNTGLAHFWEGIKSKIFGLGSALSTSTSMNALTTPGVYYYTSSTKPTGYMPSNAPQAGRVLVVQNANSSRVTQVIIPSGSASKFILIRGKDNADWGSWNTVDTTANYDTAPAAGSDHAVTSDGIFTALEDKADASDMNKVLTAGTEISANGNLNSITAPGNYWCSSANSRTVSNLPITPTSNISFGVTVFPIFGTNRYLQRFTFNIGTTAYAFRIFYRWYTSSGWSSWKEVQLQDVEPPAQTTDIDPSSEVM